MARGSCPCSESAQYAACQKRWKAQVNSRDLRSSQGRHQYKWLLLSTIAVMTGMAVPEPIDTTHISYSVVAVLLTQVMLRNEQAPRLAELIYRGLGGLAVISLWIWLLTPAARIYSGVPIAMSWSVLVGWSTVRLIRRLAREPHVDGNVLMGATAGYLHIGLTAALVMSAVETIQPGSFTTSEHLAITPESVQNAASAFSEVNYFAFSCLTTVGFGDISPALPLSRMLSVATSVIGPLYIAAVMGILIGRYSNCLREEGKL